MIDNIERIFTLRKLLQTNPQLFFHHHWSFALAYLINKNTLLLRFLYYKRAIPTALPIARALFGFNV